jgi:DnaD/phage-associated family protein
VKKMAIFRQLQTSFWRDSFILELTPEEKYFYVYLMSNEKTTQCGIYEIPIQIIVLETGYNRDTIEKLINRFIEYGKILYSYKTKEIMLTNWIKYNSPVSINTIKCVNKELSKIKDKSFIKKLYEICSNNGLDTVKIFYNIFFTPLQGAYKDPTSKEEEEEEEEEKEEQEKEEEEEGKQNESPSEKTFSATCINTACVIDFYNINIHSPTKFELELLVDYCTSLSPELVLMAIKEAVTYNAKSINYIEKIINAWINKGIQTKADLEKYQSSWQKTKVKTSKKNKGSFLDREFDSSRYDLKNFESAILNGGSG